MQSKKDRGMIKWRPFASLPEHMELIEEKNKKREVVKRVRLSNDKLAEIDEIVKKSIENSTNLVLILYQNEKQIKKEGIVLGFDFENKLLLLNVNGRKERIKTYNIIDAFEK